MKKVMDLNKAIEMIDEYLLEPNCIHKDWVECLRLCRKVLEKQIPKKPIITIDGFFNGQPIYDTWGCPNCGKVNETDFEDYEYCPICGQALDWGDNK